MPIFYIKVVVTRRSLDINGYQGSIFYMNMIAILQHNDYIAISLFASIVIANHFPSSLSSPYDSMMVLINTLSCSKIIFVIVW